MSHFTFLEGKNLFKKSMESPKKYAGVSFIYLVIKDDSSMCAGTLPVSYQNALLKKASPFTCLLEIIKMFPVLVFSTFPTNT